MKTCPNCNAQVDENAPFCSSCGTSLTDAQWQQSLAQRPKHIGLALTSLILGIFAATSFFYGGAFLGGFISIGLGGISRSRKDDGKGMAIAGMILSAIGIFITIILFVVFNVRPIPLIPPKK